VTTDRLQVLVAHSGKQHAYWHACALQKLGRLDRFITSGYYKPSHWPDRICRMSRRLHRAMQRRWHPELDPDRVERHWRFELPEFIARRVGRSRRAVDELVFRRDREFDRWIAKRRVPISSAGMFWGFQGSCLESLRAARAAGKLAVLELATVHATTAVQVLDREARRHPEWAESISNLEFPDWYRERLEQEPHAADYCVAASSYTRQSLLEIGIPDRNILLLPLGAELERFTPIKRPRADGRFRILFVGGIGQRKGIKYLLEAVRTISSREIELVLVGPPSGDLAALNSYEGLFVRKDRMNQDDVVGEMQRSDVLVLPSVLEGFGLVIPEAMATGLPVIASTHSAAPEIIRDGIDGFVLEPDDVTGLVERLLRMKNDDSLRRDMSEQAVIRAREFSWDRHRDRLERLISRLEVPGGERSPNAAAPPDRLLTEGS
jgi:alpha-maltose-1-phosphate synthase